MPAELELEVSVSLRDASTINWSNTLHIGCGVDSLDYAGHVGMLAAYLQPPLCGTFNNDHAISDNTSLVATGPLW